MKFNTYCLAPKTESAVEIQPLTWNMDTTKTTIGIWATYRVMSVRVTAMFGATVHWRVLSQTTKPAVTLNELLSHPDTVHSSNTTTKPVSKVYFPSVSPYTLDQNWTTPANFVSGMHIVWTTSGSGDVVALILEFTISLNNWMGAGKPIGVGLVKDPESSHPEDDDLDGLCCLSSWGSLVSLAESAV